MVGSPYRREAPCRQRRCGAAGGDGASRSGEGGGGGAPRRSGGGGAGAASGTSGKAVQAQAQARRQARRRRGASTAPGPRPAPSTAQPKEPHRRRSAPRGASTQGTGGAAASAGRGGGPAAIPAAVPRAPARCRAQRHRLARPAAVRGQRRRDRVPHLGRRPFRPRRHASETRKRLIEAGRGGPRGVIRPADLAPDRRRVRRLCVPCSQAPTARQANSMEAERRRKPIFVPPARIMLPTMPPQGSTRHTRARKPRPAQSAYCERAGNRRGPPRVGVRRTTWQ